MSLLVQPTCHTPSPWLFLLVSLLLHTVFVSVYVSFQHRTPFVDSLSRLPLSVVIVDPQPTPATKTAPARDTLEQHSLSPAHPQQESTTPETSQTIDLWQRGIATARRMMMAPDFKEKYLDKPGDIPNHREDLLGQTDPVNELTIESFREMAGGDIMVVFRYPDGKRVCARARRPDPLNGFDIGSWAVLLIGCH